MSNSREQEARQAYLNLLKAKGVDAATLQHRERFLQALAADLADQPADSMVYRDVVEKHLEQLPRADWPLLLAVAREYFPFWIQDIKAVAAMNAEAGFAPPAITWQPLAQSLQALWDSLDQTQFSTAENWPLKAYRHALRQEGAELDVVETRIKLVKLLLVRLRDAPAQDAKLYRLAVDNTLPLFDMKETRRLFLVVVREFYYFWIGDPEALDHIVLG
ncbi:hypothetical protein [Methylovorus sp. MP688]|uniref:hypothetical protein n=1 Tax=Methylovorus sp. (strain MP688) TaxID=887061 RepID=UPI0001EC4639|nr:hypothetical protein [Methylovorus sp. MP688]ADQ84373.1 conserved hypothetical protein [Methylovorus sp. MP688]